MTPDAAVQLDVSSRNVIAVGARSRETTTVEEPAHRRLTHRPELDGVRGLAILLVLVGHTVDPLAGAAPAGVGLFFVLSGFLITGTLRGDPDLRRFYMRRAGRLLPALGITVAAMLALGSAVLVLPTLLYVANWPFALSLDGPDMTLFGHVWSLGVEEQFYVVWPLLFALARPRWLVLVAVAVMVARAFVTSDFAFYATPMRLDGLLLGATLAIAPIRLPRWVVVPALLLFAQVVVAAPRPDALLLAGTTIASVGLVASAPTWLAILGPLGRISYSLYLYHYPLVLLFGLAGVAPAIILAWLSTRYLEDPIRRWVGANVAHPSPTPALATS